jgi:hypothetical protein
MKKKRLISIMALALMAPLIIATSCQGVEPSILGLDSDGDGWSDAQEKIAGTDPNKVDTDSDGYWDPHDPNPLDPAIPITRGIADAAASPAVTPTPPAPPTPTPTLSPVAESAEQELETVQSAVLNMMKNNGLSELEHPVTVPTNDMHRFPDAATTHGTSGVGYVLFCHDANGDGIPDTNYIGLAKTRGTYICDRYGSVTQVATGY